MILENLLLKSESVFTVHVNVRLGQLSSSVWLFVLQCVGVPQEPLYWYYCSTAAGCFVVELEYFLWVRTVCFLCSVRVCFHCQHPGSHPAHLQLTALGTVCSERVSIYTLLPGHCWIQVLSDMRTHFVVYLKMTCVISVPLVALNETAIYLF